MAFQQADVAGFRAGPLSTGLGCAVFLLMGAGCADKLSRFELKDFRSDGQIQRYHETFDESYYHIRPDGNTIVVLRRKEPSADDAREPITQIIRIETLWRSLPGKTVAHSTQINGKISYLIMGPRGGTAFEGIGSVFFDENKDRNELTGTVDLALLRPVRTVNGGQDLFEKAQLSGSFRASRDTRRVIKIINYTDRLFGPLPADVSVNTPRPGTSPIGL